MTFEEILKKFLKKYKNIKYLLDKIILIVNEKHCSQEEILELYKEDIKNNSIFQLKYKNNVENEPNEINLNEYTGNEDMPKDIKIIKYEIPVFKNYELKKDYKKLFLKKKSLLLLKKLIFLILK